MSDAADKATADDERAMALLEHQLRQQRIAASMRRFAFDPHRCCAHCSQPIGEARLRALPATGVCAACATQLEQRYARMPFA